MTEDSAGPDRHDTVRQLFARITARLEDASEIAVAGQHHAATPTAQIERADVLRTDAKELLLYQTSSS